MAEVREIYCITWQELKELARANSWNWKLLHEQLPEIPVLLTDHPMHLIETHQRLQFLEVFCKNFEKLEKEVFSYAGAERSPS